MTYIMMALMIAVPYLLIALGIVCAVLIIRHILNKNKYNDKNSNE